MPDVDYTIKNALENANHVGKVNVVAREVHRILLFSPILMSFQDLKRQLYEEFGVDADCVGVRLGYKDFEMFCRHNLAMKNVIESINNEMITPIVQECMKAVVDQIRQSHEEREEERKKKSNPRWKVKMDEELDWFQKKGFYPSDDELDARHKIVLALWEYMKRTRRNKCSHGDMNKFLEELFKLRLNAALHKVFVVRDKSNRTAKLPDLQTAMQFELEYQGARDAGTIFFKFNSHVLNSNYEPNLQLIEHYYDTIRRHRMEYEAKKAAEAMKAEPKTTSSIEWD
ncbi:unnamed protein product [Bursaphelenchus xylophilus]|uniref:(pine wood nematode) hypothetical protein n=1 Tax=Bursaphelenchus xylophilus TaxID=6326 RepID=A0A1I7RNL1_BURXY|nr:unnamed protein product [Bursaphelenchus xylophilus]CAG9124133.1 unnamed protein product [Bursaphelenchus xylophilus]